MPAINRFQHTVAGINAPALAHYDGDTAKSDTADLPEVCREIYVGAGGDIKVSDTSGFTGTFKNVATGSTLTGFFTRIWATGTTAASLIVGV